MGDERPQKTVNSLPASLRDLAPQNAWNVYLTIPLKSVDTLCVRCRKTDSISAGDIRTLMPPWMKTSSCQGTAFFDQFLKSYGMP